LDATTNSIASDNSIEDYPIECHIGESGVTVEGATLAQAIMMDCHDVVVRNSTFHNSDAGVLLIQVGNATVDSCTASGCRIGMQFIFCQDIDVRGCQVDGNSGAGIAVVACVVGEIYENNIRGNGRQPLQYIGVEYAGWGMLLYNSAYIVVYHNIFEDNQMQAGEITGGEKNQWDCGYPSGGNYWDDYEGIDEFSGPGQDVIGGDGIGDTSYYVGHDSNGSSATAIDRYPLLE
jgi:nitrous oxidase accessory protein NosD